MSLLVGRVPNPRLGNKGKCTVARLVKWSSVCAWIFGQAALGAIPGLGSVTLAWDPPSDAVAGYHLYFGPSSHNYTAVFSPGNVTKATVTGLIPGPTYYFTVTAYDSRGTESVFSNEIKVRVPGSTSPWLQISVTPAQEVRLTGAGEVGHVYQVQASQDLTSWRRIGIVTADVNGWLQFTDPSAASLFRARSYRLMDTTP
jgi:chitodextrinase